MCACVCVCLRWYVDYSCAPFRIEVNKSRAGRAGDDGKGAGEGGRRQHTNDRLYESNDSREMGKCSISPGTPPPAVLLSLLVRAR